MGEGACKPFPLGGNGKGGKNSKGKKTFSTPSWGEVNIRKGIGMM